MIEKSYFHVGRLTLLSAVFMIAVADDLLLCAISSDLVWRGWSGDEPFYFKQLKWSVCFIKLKIICLTF